MKIRNDDASWYHSLDDFKRFCEIVDKYNIKIIQAISPLGQLYGYNKIVKFDSSMNNSEIRDYCGSEKPSPEFIDYLKTRNDIIAVHGLFHTHRPDKIEIENAKCELQRLGLKPTYCAWPFNEATVDDEYFCNLKTSGKCQRLEGYLDSGTPTDEIVYLHAWRFTNGNGFGYSYEKLDKCLARITAIN